MQVTSQVAESASSDCKWHYILVYLFLSSPPATVVKCWEIQTKNNQQIEQNKKLKRLQLTSLTEAEVSERASAESASAKSASAVCSQTLLVKIAVTPVTLYTKQHCTHKCCLNRHIKGMMKLKLNQLDQSPQISITQRRGLEKGISEWIVWESLSK